MKKLKITKYQIYYFLRVTSYGSVPSTSKAHISVEWCMEPSIKENWMNHWYMVFDEDLHGNYHMSLYFLRKLHVELILGKRVN